MVGKPTVDDLGVDPQAQKWMRSGDQSDACEIAMVDARDTRWVLLRAADDPEGGVLVYSSHEWECFLDGVKKGEFDDIAS